MTQARLARELSVHRLTVARWESGERRPRGTLRVRYAELLHDLQMEVAS
ncbi:MAG: helix-turn-helix transcriptional regulator [Actinomycetales bacterium]|nr:helix-turn-helix transcriptional regulator [Candidatus Phosphoribacter baldrii]